MTRKVLRELVVLRKFSHIENYNFTPKVFDVVIPSEALKNSSNKVIDDEKTKAEGTVSESEPDHGEKPNSI